MKEYKDSEEIKRQLRIWIQECEDWLEHKEANCFRDCIDLVDEIPAADVVEVVRCKDCICGHKSPGGLILCKFWERGNSPAPGLKPDDYCSYGEREDG